MFADDEETGEIVREVLNIACKDVQSANVRGGFAGDGGGVRLARGGELFGRARCVVRGDRLPSPRRNEFFALRQRGGMRVDALNVERVVPALASSAWRTRKIASRVIVKS